MKQKLTPEEKRELIQMCIVKLNKCNELLDEAYKHHLIASKNDAANNE